MKSKNFIILILLSCAAISKGQDMVLIQKTGEHEADHKKTETPVYQFMAFSQEDDLKKIQDQLIDKHFLGNEIAMKMALLKKVYGFSQEVAPGTNANKTFYLKPKIMNSVNRIEKDLKKKIKAGEISHQVAEEEFSIVLDIAINVVNQNTSDFEKRLSSLNDSDDLLFVYLHEVKLNRVN